MPNQFSPKRRPLFVIGPSIAYIPLTRGQFALIEVADAAELCRWNWSAMWRRSTGSFSAVRGLRVGTIAMHQQLCPVAPPLCPDHRNGNTLDNRHHGNLRPATNRQNVYNSKRRKTNRAEAKGVWEYRPGFYRAAIMIAGKNKHLGCFPSRELAHGAYRTAAAEIAGEFARFE